MKYSFVIGLLGIAMSLVAGSVGALAFSYGAHWLGELGIVGAIVFAFGAGCEIAGSPYDSGNMN